MGLIAIILIAIITYCTIQIIRATIPQKIPYLIPEDKDPLQYVYDSLVKGMSFPKSKIRLSKDKNILVIAYGTFHFIRIDLTFNKRNVKFKLSVGCESHKEGYKTEQRKLLKMVKTYDEMSNNPAELLAHLTCDIAKLELKEFKNISRKIPKDML